jgi:carboxypeptidase T
MVLAPAYRYHVHHRNSFDPLPPWSSQTISVAGYTGGAPETFTVFSLKKDMDQLRAEGAALGIVDPAEITLGRSKKGKDLWVLKVGKGSSHKVLFTGCHQAREWISVEIPYLVAWYLIKNYKDTPGTPQEKRIKHLLLNREIWFVPLVNPDGHIHSMALTGVRSWRPNRNKHTVPAGTAARAPANGGPVSWPAGTYTGIDINRNYATANWGAETFHSGSVTTSRDPLRDSGENSIWCGIAPSGEPESGLIDALIQAKAFRASITYHSYSEDLLWPDAAAGNAYVDWVGRGMTTLITAAGHAYTYKSGSALYATTGDLMEFTYEKIPGRPTYTPEVRPPADALGRAIPPEDAFSGLPDSQIEDTFKENLGAALALINCAGHDAPAATQSASVASGNPPSKCQMVKDCWKVFQGWVP